MEEKTVKIQEKVPQRCLHATATSKARREKLESSMIGHINTL